MSERALKEELLGGYFTGQWQSSRQLSPASRCRPEFLPIAIPGKICTFVFLYSRFSTEQNKLDCQAISYVFYSGSSLLTHTWLFRPLDSTVCFYAFDNYALSDFRCVRIILFPEQTLYWMDDRDFTPLGLLNTNFQGVVPANNDEFYVPVGQTLQIRLQARQQRDNPSTWTL